MDYIPKIINDLRNLPENKLCADCNIQSSLYVSINNGVFLCYACADFHNSFGKQISYLKNLDDAFDEYLILYLIRGGNKRFKLYLNEMGMGNNSEQPTKVYFSRAMDYYRQTLKSEVIGEEPPQDLPENLRLQLIPIEDIPLTFPEFEEYILDLPEDKPKGFIDKAMNVIDNAYYTSLHYKERAKLNLKESGIIDKIKSGTKVSYDNIKKFGKNIYEKSKPLLNNVKTKAIVGFENVKDKTKKFFDKMFSTQDNLQNLENNSSYHRIEGSQESSIEKYIKLEDFEQKRYSDSINFNNEFNDDNDPKPESTVNNASIRASQMELIQQKYNQNETGPQSFSVFGDSTYEPQVPMPFLCEIEEHEKMPKITLNPKSEENNLIKENQSSENTNQLMDEKSYPKGESSESNKNI